MISPVSGFLLPFQGLKLALAPGIRKFVLVPLLLNILVFGLLAYLAGHYFDTFMGHYLPEDSWLSVIRPVLWLLFAVFYMVAVFYGFTIIANLISSPFNGILAAKIEGQLTGKEPPEAETNLLKAIGPAISGELQKLGYFFARAIPLLLLFAMSAIIPGLNIVVSIAWILFGFWFLAIEYADYPMGNYEMRPREQRSHLRQKRLKSIAFGAGVTTMMMVPILGFMAMPAAVAGATLYWVNDLKGGPVQNTP